jgi:hypothetical protein
MQKFTTLLLLILIFVAGQSCQQKSNEQDVSQLLEKEKTRTKVYDAIINNQDRRQGFMNHMMENDKARGMMRGNHGMMHQMIGGKTGMMNMMKSDSTFRYHMMDNMVNMAAKDSTFCRNLSETMMGNQQVMPMMKHMMQQHGHMNGGKSMNGNGHMDDGHHNEDMMN